MFRNLYGQRMASGRRDDERTAAFVERFASAMVESGMPRMPARVFAVLLTEDEGAATAAGLSVKLHASPAAVSGAVRYLTQVRLIRRERGPGERFDTYRLFNEVWYEAIYNRDHILKVWATMSREGVAAVGEDTPAGQRLGETAEFFEFLEHEIKGVLDRWRETRS
jgi:DNA-binding transcriptional regulator GbsR (MarR family)